MTRRILATTVLCALSLFGCSYDSPTSPVSPDTGTVSDPVGDVFGSGTTRWDVTAMTITRETSDVVVQLDFANEVISPMSGDTTAMIGVVDFDVDQNAATGVEATVDQFRHDSGSTHMGSDYRLVLMRYAADSSVVIIDSLAAATGRVKPVFHGRRVTIHVPLTMIGNDDGFLDASAVVGNLHQPSDIIPEDGRLRIGETNARHYALESGAALGFAGVSPIVPGANAPRIVSWVSAGHTGTR